MSIDTHIQLRTPFHAEHIRAALVNDPALADLNLVDSSEYKQVSSKQVCVIFKPWAGDVHRTIDGGFDTGTVFCLAIPGRGEAGWMSEQRLIAAILRLVPGDVCMANQDSDGPDLVRLGDVVYFDPEGCVPEILVEFGYTPGRLVIGIPERNW